MGGFATWARNIGLKQQEDGYWLYASLGTGDGGYTYAGIRLDDKIGNDNGQLSFPKSGFSTNASDVKLLDHGVTLFAQLATGSSGAWLSTTINLDKILANDYGKFKWDD